MWRIHNVSDPGNRRTLGGDFAERLLVHSLYCPHCCFCCFGQVSHFFSLIVSFLLPSDAGKQQRQDKVQQREDRRVTDDMVGWRVAKMLHSDGSTFFRAVAR